ncbi:MAG: cytochrome c family protein, partial [Xanthomonadales bacterium]|nr:cytochrome c family protein [Xanthomonadales bacterium]
MTYINLILHTQEYSVDKLSDKSVAQRASLRDMMMILMVKKVLLPIALFVLISVAQAANFAGPRKCGNCHKEEYADWKVSPHALAYSDEIF